MTEILEISDVIVDYNADTLERRPVNKEAALERLPRARDLLRSPQTIHFRAQRNSGFPDSSLLNRDLPYSGGLQCRLNTRLRQGDAKIRHRIRKKFPVVSL